MAELETNPALFDAEELLQHFAAKTLTPLQALQAVTERIARQNPEINAFAVVIPPFLMGLFGRIHAASFSFCAGVIPPMPIFGRSLLYVHSHCVA
jgi:hypothetical protein